ncbi:MAG TPA: gliding motility protein GldN [Arachidicoccus soli]|nr:gliding motility protein GldN [Arachidicoccus soli]
MKRRVPFLKIVFFSLCGCAIMLQASAQSHKKTKSRSSAYDTGSSYDTAPANKNGINKSHVPPADTTELPDNSAYGNTSNNNGQLIKNLPIEVIKDSTGGGMLDDQKKSLRKDNILVDDLADSTATPLPYSPLYASDALYRVRVWRTIDTRDKANLPYFYSTAIDGEGNTHLIDILINAMKNDSVQAFSSIDDRFTTPITFQQAIATFGSGTDTSASYDLNGNIVGYQVRQKAINADSIYKYRIKEEWVFNRRDGKTYVRILGIAPLITYTLSNGDMMDDSEHPAFWLYYPDLRTNLVRSIIANPMDGGGTITWEQIFENRLFDSEIIKSSLDAEHGFTKTPLDANQARIIQSELNNLGSKIGVDSSATN